MLRRSHSICETNKQLGKEIRDFIDNVPDAKEESITDYLVWKWRELDKRFKYINTKTFTRQEEGSTTGADFEIELWIVGRSRYISLIFQAKKFVKPYDSYVKKLNYPRSTQAQLEKLINYAKSKSLMPFYAIYTGSNSFSLSGKYQRKAESGVYMVNAAKIKSIADGNSGRRVSLEDILKEGSPFHRIFCSAMGIRESYASYLANVPARNLLEQTLPTYVQTILNSQADFKIYDPFMLTNSESELPPVRCIGVYDLRYEDEEMAD